MKRIKQTLCLCSALFAANMMTSCSDDVKSGNEKESELKLIEIPTVSQIQLNNTESDIHADMSSLGLNTLKNMIAETDGENVIMSPFSAVTALSLYHNTGLQCFGHGIDLNEVINYDDIEDVNSTINKLVRFLPDKSNGSDVVIGNSIWLPFNNVPEELKKLAETKYYADIYNYDINDYDWLKEMSATWMDIKTNGEIKDFYLDSRLDVPFQLLNTVYFKGEWEEKFNPANTIQGIFNGQNADSQVQYMNAEFSGLSYMESDKWTSIALPFHGNYEMIFVLPSEDATLTDAVEALSPDNRQDYKQANLTNVMLPKFRVEKKTNLNQYMPASSGISVYQHAIVEINEEGAKAIAFTQPIEAAGFDRISFTRPFLFSIINKVTGTSLMMGAVLDPGK